MRKTLVDSKVSNQAQDSMSRFHTAVVGEVEQAIQSNEWVIVGMAHNVPVIKAKKFLAEKNVTFKYLEYGNYFSKWKQRLAIKLWSGWPTFPQVFHKGVLVGGFVDLKKYLSNQSQAN